MIKHFYIYNETPKRIASTVTFVPLGAIDPKTEVIPVLSGSQTMLCTTEQDSITTMSISDDGSLRWKPQTFQLDRAEYTHVIAALPEKWPLETSRQFPD